MSTKTLHFGIIGAGRIGRVHAETLAFRLPEAEIIAVTDANRVAAEQLAARCGIPTVAASSKELLADPRITAGIEMSAPVPLTQIQRDHAFSAITIPVFHMTGTLDNSPIGETKAADRRIIFDEMNRAETCLVIFNGADHMTFSGHIIPRASDAQFHPLILAGSNAFWDAYLKDNSAAKEWLYNGGFASLIGEKGTFEKKLPQAVSQ